MHVKRFAAWVALLLTSLVPSIHADTYPRQMGVDALHYIFRLTLGDTSDGITGESTVHVRFLADGVKDLFLDLASAATGTGMTVSAVSSDGRQLTFIHQDDRLRMRCRAVEVGPVFYDPIPRRTDRWPEPAAVRHRRLTIR